MEAQHHVSTLKVVDSLVEQALLEEELESTTLRVETTCCASTIRQHFPLRGRASDDSALGVQVGKNVDQSGNGFDHCNRSVPEQKILIAQPRTRRCLIAADN